MGVDGKPIPVKRTISGRDSSDTAHLKKPRPRPASLILGNASKPEFSRAELDVIEKANQAIELEGSQFKEAISSIIILPTDNKIKDLKMAQEVNMAKALWDKFGSKIKFLPKENGVTKGFVVITAEGKKLFIKNFLGTEKSGGEPELVELFVYKLLENLRFGPQVEALCFEHAPSFIISYDAATEGEKQLFLGEEAINFLASLDPLDDVVATKIIALEILAKNCNLGDVSDNKGNFGIIVDESKNVSPLLVDFHFDAKIGSVLTRRKSVNDAVGFETNLRSAHLAHQSYSVGLTKALEKKDNIIEYHNAASELITEKLEGAVTYALDYCKEFAEYKPNQYLEQLGKLELYKKKIQENLSNLSGVKKPLEIIGEETTNQVIPSTAKNFQTSLVGQSVLP